MSEMVERVARAMWESEPIVYGWSHAERQQHRAWSDAVKNDCYGASIYRGFAHAAIEAMREPTGEMSCAGGEAQQQSIGSWGEPKLVWRAMIAEALK